jgi:hypothetical protein
VIFRLLRTALLVVTAATAAYVGRRVIDERRHARRLDLPVTSWPAVPLDPAPTTSPAPATSPAPTFSPAPTISPGPTSAPAPRPAGAAPVATDDPAAPAAAATDAPGAGGADPDAVADGYPAGSGETTVDPAGNVVEVAAWTDATAEGGCPDGYPVKAKLRSRLFHLPGMAAYDRTRPDRCYASAETAEADGFTRARR